MKLWKVAFNLIIIFSLLFTGFFIFSNLLNIGLPFSQVLILLTSGLIISFISLLFFSNGLKKSKQNRIVSLLLTISIKFVLYLGLILLFYLLSDIKSTAFIITFFVIYLSFTYYLVKIFIQTLTSNKSKT